MVTQGARAAGDRRFTGGINRVLGAARRAVARHTAEAVCCVALLPMAGNFLTVISRKSLTDDETVHIPAGYYHLTAGDFLMTNEHPSLVKMLAAAPLLLIRPEVPRGQEARPTKDITERWYYIRDSYREFWRANAARFDLVSFWSRVPMVALALALGALIFVYARRLFGPRAAVFAVLLFSLEPTVLAHGRVVQTDVPAALGYLLFFFTLRAYAQSPDARRALVLGLASGLALLTKFSMVVVVPLLTIAVFVLILTAPRRDQQRARLAAQAGVIALTILLVVNAAYYFHSRPPEEADVSFFTTRTVSYFGDVESNLRLLSKVLPIDFYYGLYWVLLHNRNGHTFPAALLGMHSADGWWYYFPVAFALKTTIPFLLLSVAALAWASWKLFVKREARFLVLVVPPALYTALSMTASINIGVRHFLPAFPFLFILGGAFLDWLLRRRRLRRAAMITVVLLLGWTGVEAASAYPDYMSYMNQLARKHPRWYYLSDSNVEWGEDARELAQYLRARGETKIRAAMLGGDVALEVYGVEPLGLFPPPGAEPPETRYVAVGASFLNGSSLFPKGLDAASEERRLRFLAEYRRRRPEAVFGNSTYLYRAGD